MTLVPEEHQSEPRLPDIGGAIEVPHITDVHDVIKKVPRYPETDCLEVIRSRHSCLAGSGRI